ncbi:hypothetical protein KA078_00545 [Candidatus Woesebacteria bacterium]|nr:hypothetical protein [Candidatus Woesebacteria bacterium]
MPTLFDPLLVKTLAEDCSILQETEVPIVTVSATFREDIKRMHGFPNNNTAHDVVFSRAHYSMALAVAATAWGKKINPFKAWIVDPTNYVSHKDWFSITLTEEIGKVIARHSLLKTLKDIIDQFGRKKLPILNSITPPLLYLTEHITKPILSLHIAAGNIMADQGKSVLQVITDPHVRDEYVTHADNPKVQYAVFDETTKLEFLEKASILNKKADPARIIVTGPPVDERVITVRKNKHAWRSGPLKLCITTGGLGTNKDEIVHIVRQLLPLLRKRPSPLKLLIYTSTHNDIAEAIQECATAARVAIEPLHKTTADLRLIYHPQIVDANELLIKYGFPWADGFITKPSGDMAYDAVASGSFLLTLPEWGEWEENIRERFEQKGISRKAQIEHIAEQLEILMSPQGKAQSWIEQAMLRAAEIDKLYLQGAANILRVYRNISAN